MCVGELIHGRFDYSNFVLILRTEKKLQISFSY